MAEEQTQTDPNELTIQDLATMKGIIDVASERSAFKPKEMAAVGIIYNKLELFLNNVEEQQKQAKEAAEAAAAAAPAPEATESE
ncbi:hypothetical protein OAV66_06380 [Planktomarina temperata]|jgi:hypothetical protein|nr:hypothetical protein [Planktomarina temperata]